MFVTCMKTIKQAKDKNGLELDLLQICLTTNVVTQDHENKCDQIPKSA